MIEPIKLFTFIYVPFDSNFPIRSCTIEIAAKDRKEAELIAIANNYKFFDQDATCAVTESGIGYRRITVQE